MAGRKPLPTVLKLVKGTAKKCRENKKEPTYSAKSVSAPNYLGGEALNHWNKIIQDLIKSGVMTDIDIDALAMYCTAYARWRYANEQILENGMVILAPSGFPVQSPFLPIANKAFEHMQKMLSEFGMTPSSRSRVKATATNEKEEPEDKFFRSN